MKKILLMSCLVISSLAAYSVNALADESTTMNDPAVNSPTATSPSMNGAPATPAAPGSAMMKPAMAGGETVHGDHPCKKIIEACEAAGFYKDGATTGKDIRENCMLPLMQGQAVTGVASDPKEIAACRAKLEKHKMSKQNGAAMRMQPGM